MGLDEAAIPIQTSGNGLIETKLYRQFVVGLQGDTDFPI
jgi:hypothetical protein